MKKFDNLIDDLDVDLLDVDIGLSNNEVEVEYDYESKDSIADIQDDFVDDLVDDDIIDAEYEPTPSYELCMDNVDGEIVLYMIDKNTNEKFYVNPSDDFKKAILDKVSKKHTNTKFNNSKKLTNVKCDGCGCYLQERTLDFIKRREHHFKGTEKEGLYYCIGCQIRLFDRKFYSVGGQYENK